MSVNRKKKAANRKKRQRRLKKEDQLRQQCQLEKEELMREREEAQRIQDEIMRGEKERETKEKERKEFLKWKREIRLEKKRREAAETKKKEREKFLKWRREIKENELEIRTRPILVSSAIKKNTQKWIIKGDDNVDPTVFLNSTSHKVIRLINSIDSVGKKVHTILVCKIVRADPETAKDTFTIAHFSSKTHSMISAEDVETEYPIMKEKLLESLANYQKLGSGWRLHSIEMLEIFITKFKPLGGKSYKPFPKTIVKTKAVINMENNDDQCFKWAVTRALHPVDRDAGQISKILREQSENYIWNEFPTKVKDICKFETNNNINVNVFSYDDETKKVYTLRLSKTNYEETVNLFFYDNHYGVAKNLSRLVSSQLIKEGHKKHICNRCLNHFWSPKMLENHLELCQNHDHQRHVYPKKSNKYMIFKQYQKFHRVPFAEYADFECYIEPTDNKIGKGTTQYQKHEPSGFCYTIKCMDETVYKDKTVLYTAKESGEDLGKKIVECLEDDLKKVYGILKTAKPIKMTEEEELGFQQAEICYACKEKLLYAVELGELSGKLIDDRVRDHCHLTGKYRGAAHSKCNLKMKTSMFVPVLFHNLEGHDSHLFVKSLGLSEGNINCIPKTDEKYISFSKNIVMETFINVDGKEVEKKLEIRFLDSLKLC